jgi:hypothetical protein
MAKLPELLRRERRLFEHFRFSSNSGHIAAPHEPTQWARRRHGSSKKHRE